MTKFFLLPLSLVCCVLANGQATADTQDFRPSTTSSVKLNGHILSVCWSAGKQITAQLDLQLEKEKPLISSIRLIRDGQAKEIITAADPVFLLTVGKRDLVSQNGWNIFFDKVPLKPHQTYRVDMQKNHIAVRSKGSRIAIQVDALTAPGFAGHLEIVLYKGSPLLNIAAVLSTAIDSTAIVYDAGITSRQKNWDQVSWADVYDKQKEEAVQLTDTSKSQAVKYRAIIGSNTKGSIAVFPGPHQYFYPLDEAFNLHFTWYGNQYNKMLNGYGIGIRQDLYGDNRYVPWFNAPPNTWQRLNFFCLLSEERPAALLKQVKAFTHQDSYLPLPGYKTMVSHFHNEHIMKTVLAGKPVPDTPNFIKVFRAAGVNIVHLAEFHYTAHPKGPEEQRLAELKALFSECRRLSGPGFLLLPGEEPNEFFGGHWLQLFPKPIYWIMARKDEQPFSSIDPAYGKVYRIRDTADMLQLLQQEKGLAWTAHARTKGSTGFPDAYKNEPFFLSDRFLGAAWKAMPADLSQPKLGKRILDLMDDMNNWGLKKKVIAEADLFSIEPENEMYAHLNVNYLQLAKLPDYKAGWMPVLDKLQAGKFFSTTGEVLIPLFTADGKEPGESYRPHAAAQVRVSFRLAWTFPLNYAEIVSGDGKNVYRHTIDLSNTRAFGQHTFHETLNLAGRKWVRLEAWDVAANGAFTQTIWLK